MISFLKWEIRDLNTVSLTILTSSWIWYEVLINELIYSKLLLKEWEAEVHIYHNRTENSENLFWFMEIEEKKVFKELIKISWVWWKVAMQILWIWINRLLEAISFEDNKTIEWIKWIGKKSAEKIILELKDKDFWINFNKTEEKNTSLIDINLKQSVLDSLSNYGYDTKQVERVLLSCPKELDTVEKLIPYVIKNI